MRATRWEGAADSATRGGVAGGGGVTGRGDAAMAFVVGGVWRGMRAVSATPVMSCTRETRKRRENAHA